MEAIRVQQKIEKRGELTVRNLPVEEGEEVEVLVLLTSHDSERRKQLTADQLLHSDIVGMWKDRTDIPDTIEYARQLRDEAERRVRTNGMRNDSSGQ
ncbi:MAG: hypothetical protein AB7H80_03605 [Candidatus Kapaibacterium sp.]